MGVTAWEKVVWAREEVETGRFGVNRVCQVLGISKTSYYEAKEPKDRFLRKYEGIKAKVARIIEDHGRYGIRRIKAALQREDGIVIDKQVLGKLLIYWGLELKRKVRRKKPSMIQGILNGLRGRANLLQQAIITRALQAISSDITRLEYEGGVAYLCVHKDVFAQVVYGWSLGLTMETSLVIASFKMAVMKAKKLFRLKKLPEQLIWHQDQGSQYTSYEYVETVLGYGKLSYSEVGTPGDNPGQESFFGRFKEDNLEEVRECRTFEELERLIKKRIKKYNCERLHTSIGYKPPMEFLKSFLNSTGFSSL